jgi:hypothetical protein
MGEGNEVITRRTRGKRVFVSEKLLYLISILIGLIFSAREKGVRPEIKESISMRVGDWFI